MYVVKKICQLYHHSDLIEVLGQGESQDDAIEILREYLLQCNQRILKLRKTMDVPDCIDKLAQAAVKHNPDLNITVRDDGIVFVDGQGPEMDYYTITLIIDLTNEQREMIGERIEELLDNAEDWQLSDEELVSAVQSWVDILKILDLGDKVEQVNNNFKHIKDRVALNSA